MAFLQTIEFATRGRGTLAISDDVARIVRASGVSTGLANVFVMHTSCSLIITENADPTVRRDLETLAQRWAPDGDSAYQHDQEGDDDMAAHARNILAGSSLCIPVDAGQLKLGCWQGIYLWEHRSLPHRRRVVVTVLG